MEVWSEAGPSSANYAQTLDAIPTATLDSVFAQLLGQNPSYGDIERLVRNYEAIERAASEASPHGRVASLDDAELADCRACADVQLGPLLRRRFFETAKYKVQRALINLGISLQNGGDGEDEHMAPEQHIPVASQVRHVAHLLARDVQYLIALQCKGAEIDAYRLQFCSHVKASITPAFLAALHSELSDIFWAHFLHSPKHDTNSPLLPVISTVSQEQYLFIQRVRFIGLRIVLDNALDKILVDAADLIARFAARLPSEGEVEDESQTMQSWLDSKTAWLMSQFPLADGLSNPKLEKMDQVIQGPIGIQAVQLRYLIISRETDPQGGNKYDAIADLHANGDFLSVTSARISADKLKQPMLLGLQPLHKTDLPGTQQQQQQQLADHLQPFKEAEVSLVKGFAKFGMQRQRVSQFFDAIKNFPDWTNPLIDLRDCIKHTGQMDKVTTAINAIIHRRLLHPGAQTQDIIEFFVLLIHALRATQHGDVMLSRLAHPIRRYLRSRPDTVSVVVSSLLGNRQSFELLREELDRAKHIKTPFSLEATKIRGKDEDEYGDAEEEEDEGGGEADDATWQPRPVDAGPNYRKTGRSDVISMLISIFDDREGFITALERTMAEQLLQVKGYQHEQQYLSNLTLKNRFGEAHFARIDIMLQDIVNSRRYDAGMQDRPLSMPSMNADELTLVKALHPIIVSRHCWPDLTGEAGNTTNMFAPSGGSSGMGGGGAITMMGGGGGEGGTAVPSYAAGSTGRSGNLRIPGAEVAQHKLPARFQSAMDTYVESYKRKRTPQTMRFLPGLGTMSVKLTMDDGRVIEEDDVTALQASVVELASTKGSSAVVTAGEIAVELEVDKASALNALYFWTTKGVLFELITTAESFQVMDTAV
ncbi:hypothetical protein K437DRAFT_256574 [Tilletiaria anomala UBC 951]|uniref:Cullin family profile domain-containing protein n=1 Tax=Tilletiaria anomala (strain ATCC 24038 / CBS 436.72 / UBC 951) TaxID=1037660 RepID=A0A066W304_TILAU|nr:uncharacterized protein K437DRAFT_256574 [Tilletiaria anomala UBC 951]KDN45459.1 hypothetical protein K437DRAFT_256574 [Tilletiaria anomala UBC 951]